MGNFCTCAGNVDSEDLVYKVLNEPCFSNLTREDLENLLFIRLKGEPDYVNRTNLKITKEVFNEIAKDIYNMQYTSRRKKEDRSKVTSRFSDKKLAENFTKDLYNFLEINNSMNSLIFKLIMIPFILKEKDHFEDKVNTFYDYLSRANFSYKQQYSLTKPDMKYPQFAENFFIYLSIVLSGFTKLIMEKINLSQYNELLLNDFQENINNYFKPENMREYYSHLIKEWVKDLEEKENFTDLNSTSITKEDFYEFCENNKFIVDYFALRKNFRQFVDKKTPV